MPDVAIWILVGLAAILVGSAVPALLQLRRTLKTAEETLSSTGRHVDESLRQLATTLERVNRAAAELEHGASRARSLAEALGGLGDMLTGARASLGSVASLGASLVAVLAGAVRAAFSREDDAPAADEPETAETIEGKEMAR